jgi:Fe2+ or Zn2+ uptake regulation protein
VLATRSSESLNLGDLRRVGLRATAPRLAMLATVREGGHLTVEEIAVLARRRLGTVSTQAVYDVLRALTLGGSDPAHRAGRERSAVRVAGR